MAMGQKISGATKTLWVKGKIDQNLRSLGVFFLTNMSFLDIQTTQLLLGAAASLFGLVLITPVNCQEHKGCLRMRNLKAFE